MPRFEDLQPNAAVRGILPDIMVTVVSAEWHGANALPLVYREPTGRVADEILYRHDEHRIEIVETGRPWGFDGDGALFRLVSEAYRIRLAHLFDPLLAVHTSLVTRFPTRLRRCMRKCYPVNPCVFCSPTIPVRARRSWRGCSSGN